MEKSMYIHTKDIVFRFYAGRCKSAQNPQGSREENDALTRKYFDAGLCGVFHAGLAGQGLLDVAFLLSHPNETPGGTPGLVDAYVLAPDAPDAEKWTLRISPIKGPAIPENFGPVLKIQVAPESIRNTLRPTPPPPKVEDTITVADTS